MEGDQDGNKYWTIYIQTTYEINNINLITFQRRWRVNGSLK
jgi:hypothetical protein